MIRWTLVLIVFECVSSRWSASAAFTSSRPLNLGDRTASLFSTVPDPICTKGVTTPSTLPRTLFTKSRPIGEGSLPVDSIHTLHFVEYGNPDGLPALFLHGGPGAGCFPNHARFFDPSKYRILLLDQRGSGRSTPRGEIRNNTLGHLVHDCETLRTSLGIDQWHVVLGGSWGSTLALAYAQEHPQSVGSLVLRGVCLLRPQEVDWLFDSGGAAKKDPEGWEEFQRNVGIRGASTEPREVLHAYYDRILGTDPGSRIQACRSWSEWEMRVFSRRKRAATRTKHRGEVVVKQGGQFSFQDLNGKPIERDVAPTMSRMLTKGIGSPSDVVQDQYEMRPIRYQANRDETVVDPQFLGEHVSQFIPAQAILTCYYSVNERYATNNWDPLDEERIKRIRHIPCVAVHGEQDEICPVDTALELSHLWPEMELRIPLGAGHSMYDPAIMNELVRATERMETLKCKSQD
eukprot:CAMPEP_0116827998 /NCGR_PEP_ID=MMETSP0418-20121206/3413_1 /TAXON_ID=1158023 /ORGANISM="Astrosyne radiata, Strain 13vi08-1A" /LENGTH=459 /DNA_ID=CAMNT_0004456841 /DNA_START=1 /DNA_END=1380 /DNA_ORIENTATION=+